MIHLWPMRTCFRLSTRASLRAGCGGAGGSGMSGDLAEAWGDAQAIGGAAAKTAAARAAAASAMATAFGGGTP
eukprot:CAMPEP_0183566856 /NCGR_PEP_ID=MMETSP0371-20130417/112922_1 /TAXON_ID=268820 /ORGANISM="Peridinium aciculiferum, Strain PAER-2" /LENGTH=72 /DNA_ID=CAMNT_0025776183 /DNA_START=78 /DNA_END=293 /DNA_ORIENTATION=-